MNEYIKLYQENINIDTVNINKKYDMDDIADKRGNYDINGIFDVNSK